MQNNEQTTDDNDKLLNQALRVGLDTLSDDSVKVKSSHVEALANFKSILRSIMTGELILISKQKLEELTKKDINENSEVE